MSASIQPSSNTSIPHIPARHEHSWRYSPFHYTAISCMIWLAFFVQPHSFRVWVWSHIRPLIADEKYFMLVGAITVHFSVTFLGNLMMALIYYLELPFFEQFRIQTTKPWPWKRSETERNQFFTLVRQSIALIAFNQFVLQPIMIWFSYGDQKKFGMNGDMDKVPVWYTTLFQIAICMVVEDTLFYWAHRALHWPRIYGYVHKVHHQYRTSIGIASEYAHPIEFIFSNAIPFSVGPLLCGMHFYSYFMWSILRMFETIDGHCGYEFPWSPYRLLPFSGSSTAHDFHHSHNVGNFSSFFTWWDRICGTDVAFRKWELQQEQLRIAQLNSNHVPAASAAAAASASATQVATEAEPTDSPQSTTRVTRSRSKKD